MLNTTSPLVAELQDKGYRESYVASQIRIGLPFQIRALRLSRGWTQDQLAEATGMAQPRICEIEKPGQRKLNLETLLRLAAGLDVGLLVAFVPFGELIDRLEAFDPETVDVPAFDEEVKASSAAASAGQPVTVTAAGFITGSFDARDRQAEQEAFSDIPTDRVIYAQARFGGERLPDVA